jgi:chromate reductase
MITIVGLSGSLRRASYNSAVLRVAAALMPADSVLQIESIADVPLYNADEESARGIPPAVARIKEAITSADGLLLVSPEYNNSIPGVTKNAIDWLSRPSNDIPRVFRGRPVALAGASPGGFGTILSQNAWLAVFRTLGVDFWTGGRLMVSRAANVIGIDGEITDVTTRESIQKFVAGFVAHVQQRRARSARVDVTAGGKTTNRSG